MSGRPVGAGAPGAAGAGGPAGAGAPLEWPAALEERVAETFRHYPNRRSAALPLLWLALRNRKPKKRKIKITLKD